MVADLSFSEIGEVAVGSLVEELGGKLIGLALFGSVAGEREAREAISTSLWLHGEWREVVSKGG